MAYIYRTPAGAGSNSVFTFSCWFKRAKIGALQTIFSAGPSSYGRIIFDTSDTLAVYDGATLVIETTRVFRDPGAWMHLVLAYDTGESGTDKVKLYINGTLETAFGTDNRSTASPLNYVNDTEQQNIGADTSNPFYGEMSHVQMVDGAQLAPTEFGEVDATSGIWKIKTSCYATPGTNGFCLKMEDRTNLDLDSSSNAFTWTTSGTITPTYDNPSNNFCTMNPVENFYGGGTFSNGNTTAVTGSGVYAPLFGGMGVSAGKWYWEVKLKAVGATAAGALIGVASNRTTGAAKELGDNANDYGFYGQDGKIRNNNAYASYGAAYALSSIIGVALDVTNNKLYFSKDGVWENSGVPTSGATGTGAFSITMGSVGSNNLDCWVPSASYWDASTGTYEFNFGNGYFGTTAVTSANADDAGIGAFEYDVPAGYYAICTKNIKAYGG